MFLLLNIAYAAPFDVEIVSIKDKIVVDELAEYDVVITNNLNTDEEFTIKKAGYPFWDMYTQPLQSPITLEVPASSTASLRLLVDPIYITVVDTYTLSIGVVNERTGQEQKAPITVGIKSTEPLIGGYIPTVLGSASISPQKIDPRDEFTIKIVLNNQNVINYTKLTLKIDSNLVQEEMDFPLGPKEDKTIEISKKLDDMTVPQDDKLVIAIFLDERIIVNPIVKEFEVVGYVSSEKIPQEQSFLKIRSGVELVTNNPGSTEKVKVETSLLKNLFSSTSPRAETVKEDGKYFLVWEVDFSDSRTVTVRVVQNYRPLVVIIVLAIIAIVLYFVFRSPIVVRKGIANVRMSHGGVSDAKVVVRVKNRSQNQITDIEVTDYVPHIAHVEKEISIGSMQPHAILKHPKRGIMLKWNVDTIEPGDERVMSYRMISKLPILGEFNLPSASARAKVGTKMIITNSNRVTVGG